VRRKLIRFRTAVGIFSLALIQLAVPFKGEFLFILPNSRAKLRKGDRNKRMVKLKLSLCFTKYHAMKMFWWSGCIAPRVLNLDVVLRALVN
jgi:hypothetical protein